MKKSTAISLGSVALLVVAAAAALIVLHGRERLLLRSPMLAQAPSVITYMEGSVEILPDGAAEWISAAIGDRVREGDRIRTGADGLADIRIHDEGVIRILSGTEAALEVLTIRRQSIGIDRGTLFAKFHRLFDSQELRFRTPEAIAAVRGTELVFRVDDEGTAIEALSGITEVFNPDHPSQRILLAYQKSTRIAPGTPPTDPEDIPGAVALEHRRVFNGINREEVFLISQDILFAADRADILPESLDELDEVAALLALRREKVLIAGHTADVGGTAGQVDLSERRAAAIADELIARGIPARRLSTVGYGGSRPVGDNATAEGRAANRRVEFLVVE